MIEPMPTTNNLHNSRVPLQTKLSTNIRAEKENSTRPMSSSYQSYDRGSSALRRPQPTLPVDYTQHNHHLRGTTNNAWQPTPRYYPDTYHNYIPEQYKYGNEYRRHIY